MLSLDPPGMDRLMVEFYLYSRESFNMEATQRRPGRRWRSQFLDGRSKSCTEGESTGFTSRRLMLVHPAAARVFTRMHTMHDLIVWYDFSAN